MTGNHHENIAHAVETFLEIRTSEEVWRKCDAREIPNVFAVCAHCLQQVELNDAAEANVAARPGELQRQRRSPGTGADNRNRIGGFATY